MKILNFLYYSLYTLSKSIKREKAIDHIIACNFLSMMVSTNIFMIATTIKFFKIEFSNAGLFFFNVFFFSIFIINYLLFKKYFIKKKNNIWIIKIHEQKYLNHPILMKTIATAYIVSSILGFYLIAIYIANGTFG